MVLLKMSALNMLYYIIPFVILLGILVFIHEFGHFIVARMLGVKVSAFSIGFGKVLWSRTDKHGTCWQIAAVPLGGYCQFLGDADASSSTAEEALNKLSEEDKKHAFAFQNPFKKLAIVVAGPGFNYLLAILIYFILFASFGKFTIPPIVGGVVENGAAYEAGIVPGDKILKINGIEIKDFGDIAKEIAMCADHRAQIDLLRGEEMLHFDVGLKEAEKQTIGEVKEKQFMLGIHSVTTVSLTHEDVSLSKALGLAFAEVWDVTETTLRGVGQMITGKRSGKEVGGIIRIAEMTGDISKNQSLLDFVLFLALLSINLGLLNLFPIPVLDGGHVVIFLAEIISGREINESVKNMLFKIGLSLLILLMIYATWNDIVHLVNRIFN